MDNCGALDFSGILPYLLDILDIVLSLVGLIPVAVPIAGQVGTATDAVTIVLNALAEEPVAMVLSIIALVPIAGQFSGAIKIIYKVVKIFERVLAFPGVRIVGALVGIALIGGAFYFIYFI
jgi:hypothetical protein